MNNVKMKLNLKNYFLNSGKSPSSVINTPILKDKEVVGFIVSYDIDTDEAIGCMFDDIIPNFNENNQILSMEIL